MAIETSNDIFAARDNSTRACRSARLLRILFILRSRVAKPIQCFHFNSSASLLAVAFAGEHTVSIWSINLAKSDPRYRFACVLKHTRKIKDVAWLSTGETAAGLEDHEADAIACVIVVRTDDGSCRFWAPTVDSPDILHPTKSPASITNGYRSFNVARTLAGMDLSEMRTCLRWGEATEVVQRLQRLTSAIDHNIPISQHIVDITDHEESAYFRTDTIENLIVDLPLMDDLQHCLREADQQEVESQELGRILRISLEITKLGDQIDANSRQYLADYRSANVERSAPLCTGSFSAAKSRCMLWARYSGTQDRLLSHLIESDGGAHSLRWKQACTYGVFFWLHATERLRNLAESIARTEFAQDATKDPTLCSIIFLALGKVRLVEQIWRQAIWHPEHHKMLRFLQNDFSEHRWKAAAQKNAYALLSQRRFQLAVMFFLLSGSLEEAVSVSVRSLNDPHMAFVLCQIWHHTESGSQARSKLLREDIIRQAAVRGDRHAVLWAASVLEDAALAANVLASTIVSADCHESSEDILELYRNSKKSDSAELAPMLILSRSFNAEVIENLPERESEEIVSEILCSTREEALKLRLAGLNTTAEALQHYTLPSRTDNDCTDIMTGAMMSDIGSAAPLRDAHQEATPFDFSNFDM